jgi:LacI family transcriptional regulator
MTEYLISMGHRDIAFVAGHPDHVAVCTRTAGFLEAMQAAGLSVPDDFVYAGLNSFESGEQAGAALLAKPERPTAIFAANDEMAAGVCVAARHRGLDIPRDLSVCGFDDIPIAIQVWPALTSVTQPIQDMAEKAAELLIRQIKEPDSAVEYVEIRSELMVRESTYRAPEADA